MAEGGEGFGGAPSPQEGSGVWGGVRGQPPRCPLGALGAWSVSTGGVPAKNRWPRSCWAWDGAERSSPTYVAQPSFKNPCRPRVFAFGKQLVALETERPSSPSTEK